jgi:adenylosuccinate lyase
MAKSIQQLKNMVQKWLDFEAAITSEQVRLGLVPKAAADDIISKCTVKHLVQKW